MTDPSNRRFLFLQGPHGPFFHRLAKMLRAAGGQIWRVGFNAGDRAFWFGGPGYIPYRGTIEDWPAEDWPATSDALVAEPAPRRNAVIGPTGACRAD